MSNINFRITILIIFISYCKNNKTLRIEEIEKENGSTISIRNFERISINNQGKLLWKLNAKETFYFNKTDISILYDMDVEQYENGKIKSKIKADKGIINKKENKINASGNIFIKTTEGKILEAEELEMDTETNTVTSDKRVIIKSDGTTIKGVGLIAENGLNKFKILKPEGLSSSGSNPLKK
jgi:LPS export ABC transporter protein LptC